MAYELYLKLKKKKRTFTAALFVIAENGKQVKCSSTVE